MTGAFATGEILVGGLALVALALGGAAIWNRQLRREVALHTAEMRAVIERLRLHGLVLAQVRDAIVVVNQEQRITMWNPGAEALFGIPAAEALGRDTEALFGAMLVGGSRAGIREQVGRTGHWRGEARVRRRTGGDVHVIATVQALREAGGEPAGRLVVVHDIDARKRAENELRARLHAESEGRRLEARIQQVQKLESLGVLAGGIAHDFNNLLVGMLGHAGLALMDLPPGSPLRARIEQIETCATRAAELTNQMLAYSGKGRFVVEPIDVSAVVREMSNLLQTAVTKRARLHLELAGGLPAVLADGAQLRQVVMNLITNASDAMGEREGTITLRTGMMRASRDWLADPRVALSRDPGDYVYVEVRDEGCGMDAATRARIFEPFFTTKFAGRGLGLAAVLGIVRGHRGALRIDTEPGRGTAFHVLFPASAAVADAPGGPTPARLRARRQARVLVVDDEPSVLAIARETLTRAGFTVVTASNGSQALDQVRAGDPPIDAVLLDMTMPGMSGVETLRGIHAIAGGVPVVLTSGYTQEEAATRCAGEPLAAFIQKPFAPAALVTTINDAISAA